MTDAELLVLSDVIKDETTAGANTATRIGQMHEDIILNKVNNLRTITIDGITFDLSANRTWTTGAVDKFANWYNVTLYGLVGDGVTDNAAAFASLVATATAGSWLYFPTGTYLFLTGATITKKLHIEGDGIGNSVISTSVNNLTLIDYDYTGDAEVADVIISRVQIYCSAVTTPVSPSIGLRVSNSSSRLRIENIYVGGFYNNVVLTNPVEYVIDRLYCVKYVETGLDMRSSGSFVDSGDGCIINSQFSPASYNSVQSIYHQNGGGLKITNTKFNYQASPLFQTQCHYKYEGTGLTVDLNISNCSFENYTLSAINVSAGSGTFREVTITGCDIGDTPTSGAEGIIIDNVDYVSITGNTLKSTGGGTRNAITLTNCDNVTLFNTYQGWTNNVVQSGATNVVTPVLIDPAISPANDDFLQRKSGVWTNRTVAQVASDLGVIAGGDGNISVTGAGTLDIADANKTVFCSGTTADYTVTLPTAVGNTGKWYNFVGVDGLTKIVTVDGNASETINGYATRPFSERGGFRIVSDGSNWQVMNEKPSWIAYTPTFTGTSGQPTSTVKYSLQGKQFTLFYTTSAQAASGTGMSFGLPSTNDYRSLNNVQAWSRVMSNSAYVSTGMSEIVATDNVVNLYLTAAGGSIASTGNKAAAGTIIFELQ